MADNLTSLQLLTLSQTYRGDVVNQINKSVQFLKFVPIVTGVGKNCAWAVEKDGELVESYAEGADAANFGSTQQSQGILTWGLYRANPHVTQLAMDAAATSHDPSGNKQAWARQVVAHAASLADKLNQECFNGAGTTGLICGLDSAIGLANNTYAGIDRSQAANAFFRPTVIAPGAATAPTMQDLRDDVRQIFEACGENPDVAFCAPVIFNYIGGLFDATRRQNIDQVRTARGVVTLDVGFRGIELDGMVFMKDRRATANTIYYINTSAVRLEVLPSAQQRMLEKLGGFTVQANDGFGTVPMSFDYEMLAKTGASEKAQIRSTCQLVVDRPNKHGVRKNVATS